MYLEGGMFMPDDLVSVTEAAKILGLQRARTGVLCREGRFPGAHKVGATWVIPRESVEGFSRLKPGPKRLREEDAAIVAAVRQAVKGTCGHKG